VQIVNQKLEDILGSLRHLEVDWKDETAIRVIAQLRSMPVKAAYSIEDVEALLDANFDEGILICRLFMGLSKDQFTASLHAARGSAGIGVKAYRADSAGFLSDLVRIGLLDDMANEANRKAHWSDVLEERLRSGRGSAIAGQRRGRGVEDFAEEIIKTVFGDDYEARCTFLGPRGTTAKCDFAIPSKTAARILIESKGYAATGSKMTDILGDIHTIISAKRADTALLFFTDGLTWRERQSDMRKLVDLQNKGDIMRIYTYAMADQFEKDLRQLKSEGGL
jgi:DpnII restriction endonuclease